MLRQPPEVYMTGRGEDSMNVITEVRQFYQLSGDSFGEGGESRIYGVEGKPSLCAKIYKKVKPEQEAKIQSR